MQRKLVDHLVETGLVARGDVQRCVLRAKMGKGSVVDEMVERLEVDEGELAAAMAEFWGMECDRGDSLPPAPAWQSTVTRQRAEEHGVLPVEGGDDDGLRLAVYDVDKAQPVVEAVRDETGISPELVLAPRDVVQAEIQRHYNSAALSGVRRMPSKPGEEELMTRKTPTAGVDALDGTEGASTGGSTPSRTDGAPTRQVDLAADNPFMDLVQESAKPNGEPATEPDPDSKPLPKPEPKPVGVEEAPADFFSDLDEDSVGFDDESESFDDESSGEFDDIVPDDGAVDEFDAALQEFDEELGVEESEAEALLMAESSSVNWGDFGDVGGQSGPAPAAQEVHPAGSNPGASMTPPTMEGSQSGLIPNRRGRSGVFDIPDEGPDGELTLAEVVSQQRKMIRKLEREVAYQKGVMQIMAELLVEARVLSQQKLKKALKAFKEEQRKKYE